MVVTEPKFQVQRRTTVRIKTFASVLFSVVLFACIAFAADKYTTVIIREEVKVRALTGRNLPEFVRQAVEMLPSEVGITADYVAVITDLKGFLDAFRKAFPDSLVDNMPAGFACFFDYTRPTVKAEGPGMASMCSLETKKNEPRMIFVLLNRSMLFDQQGKRKSKESLEGDLLLRASLLEAQWNELRLSRRNAIGPLRELALGLIRLSADSRVQGEILAQQWTPRLFDEKAEAESRDDFRNALSATGKW
ncbi:MAG: hypothetical protein A2660_00805 [Candidatus Doudnabacteria bacterium RIFCSPHIGHO2_01_FULL_45_18]|uniref:Uncharacterized protein n=1 Tax=Candidatus Doudnabacteria bacterium RIFCSPHIGHO2_01_FULL_45_18 TaxID=1817823 RepID=A0A1F5NSU1_9BACT|nr:MAG: hypothetical protein A2660_00805 [Candidatus Doudnabacteria bacterium RIFCSPHIGHO2_01_FULL_45_18]